MVEHDDKSQSKPGDSASINKSDMFLPTKTDDATQSNDAKKTEISKDKSNTDQTLISPKSDNDQTFTSPQLPPLIPDAKKT